MTDKAKKFSDTLLERGINFDKVEEPVETYVVVLTTMPKEVQEIGKELGYTTAKVESTDKESKVHLLLNF